MGIALLFKFTGAEHLCVGDFPAGHQKTEAHGGIPHHWPTMDSMAVFKGIAVEKNIPCHHPGIKGHKGMQTTDGQPAMASIAPPRRTVITSGPQGCGAEILG